MKKIILATLVSATMFFPVAMQAAVKTKLRSASASLQNEELGNFQRGEGRRENRGEGRRSSTNDNDDNVGKQKPTVLQQQVSRQGNEQRVRDQQRVRNDQRVQVTENRGERVRGEQARGGRGRGEVVQAPSPQIQETVRVRREASQDGRYYDRNRDGNLDRRWDRNRDDRLDRNWDSNRDGRLDRRYDRNDNERIDRRLDRNGNGQIDRRYESNNSVNRWSTNWRNDNRYDWRSHRQRYSNYYRPGRYYAPYRSHHYSGISIGFSIGSGFYGSRYWINNPSYYRLPPAYGSYRWVRYYDDILLVDIRNGYVVDVIEDFFW